MKAYLFGILSLALAACNSGETPTEQKTIELKAATVPIDYTQFNNLSDTATGNTKRDLVNKVTDIFVSGYKAERVDLKPYHTAFKQVEFETNPQYSLIGATIGSLSGDGSAQIMTSITPVVNGKTTLYFHNPNNTVRGCEVDINFILFFRKNF
jgi:hypothetical protein